MYVIQMEIWNDLETNGGVEILKDLETNGSVEGSRILHVIHEFGFTHNFLLLEAK